MSILGKVLAIFNVLGVVGVLALLSMSFGKQLVWQYAVFRQELMRDGLPVDEGERNDRSQSLAENIGPTTQKELFPLNPLTTQKAEVERVRTQLQGKIQAAGDKKKQISLLARILTPMALTHDRREQLMAYQIYLGDDKAYARLQKRLEKADTRAKKLLKTEQAKTYEEAFRKALTTRYADPPGPLGEAYLAVKKADANIDVARALPKVIDKELPLLQEQFNKMFQDALEGTATPADTNKTGASSQKRRVIAFLLFNMVDVLPDEAAGAAAKPANLWDDPKYKRFINVVGVRAAAQAINEEAALLADIAEEVEVSRLRQRGAFAVEHRKAIDLVEEKSALLDTHNSAYARAKKEYEDHEVILKKRKLDVEYYDAKLREKRSETAVHLKDLRRMSDQLFVERVKLRDATRRNQELEKDIRTLEGVR